MYNSNVTLILIEDSVSAVAEEVLFNKLDMLFDALVLLYGIDDLINIPSVDKFKKEIRVCPVFTKLVIFKTKFKFYLESLDRVSGLGQHPER